MLFVMGVTKNKQVFIQILEPKRYLNKRPELSTNC